MPARIGSATRRSARSRGRLAVGHLPMRLINRTPGRSGWLALAILPFALLLALYLTSSTQRLEINPNDKLTPMKWSAHDMLIVVTRMDYDANADGDDEVEDDDKDPMSA